MSNYKLHFGCRVYNTDNAKLTRDNYAPITLSTRRNTLMSNRSLFKGMKMDEANEHYWELFKYTRLVNYRTELKLFLSYIDKLKDSNYMKTELTEFIEQKTNKRIEFEVWENNTLFINSENPTIKDAGQKYAEILEKNTIDDSCNDELRDRFNKYQQDLKKIKEYKISDMIWLKSPDLLKEWKRESPNNKGFDIPDEWFKDYAMRKAPYYTDKKCKSLQEIALENFDYNMKYFKSLNAEKFNAEIDDFIKNHPKFEIVQDLREYKATAGIYIMILDEYKQVYIGITRAKTGVKGRIQEHWSRQMPLDRLIWGSVKTSIISIDSFRALDTTRILFEPHPEFCEMVTDENGNPKKGFFMNVECNIWNTDVYLGSKEYELINNAFSPEFLCNRCAGGGESLLEAFLTRKERNLIDNENSSQ